MDLEDPVNRAMAIYEDQFGLDATIVDLVAKQQFVEALHEIPEFDGLLGTAEFNTENGLENIFRKLETIKFDKLPESAALREALLLQRTNFARTGSLDLIKILPDGNLEQQIAGARLNPPKIRYFDLLDEKMPEAIEMVSLQAPQLRQPPVDIQLSIPNPGGSVEMVDLNPPAFVEEPAFGGEPGDIEMVDMQKNRAIPVDDEFFDPEVQEEFFDPDVMRDPLPLEYASDIEPITIKDWNPPGSNITSHVFTSEQIQLLEKAPVIGASDAAIWMSMTQVKGFLEELALHSLVTLPIQALVSLLVPDPDKADIFNWAMSNTYQTLQTSVE